MSRVVVVGGGIIGASVASSLARRGAEVVILVVPTITGSAWVTGTSQYVLDPTDPFPTGFLLG